METILTLDINTDHLVDELAQRNPHLFQELHYDRHTVKQAVETLLRVMVLHVVPIESETGRGLLPNEAPDEHTPVNEEPITPPDSCIWLP